ncbi:hypothetical protein OIU78_007038 [Salix suchowensis]|nr:hypothetical protein OIU78_007038 [Salix suchowensis]
MDKIRRLQNGSDVRGVAMEGEKGRTVDLSPPAVEAIAESFGEWVINGLEKEKGRVAANVLFVLVVWRLIWDSPPLQLVL